MYDYKSKEKNLKILNMQMLNKTLSMFEYENLPMSIPQKELEKILQTKGYAFLTEINGVIYALSGNLSGELDEYYNPTKILVTNPHLNINKEYDVKKDGVLILNDDLSLGLIPLFERINYLLIENEINIIMWGFNSRQQKTISASDDKTKSSAETYIRKIISGDLSVIADSNFLESLTVHNANGGSSVRVSEFIELQQYLKSNLLNEVGLSSNAVMKKERLITSEVEQGEDSIFTLTYTMMKNRLLGVEKINKMYNLNISVDFGSVWALKNKKLVDGVNNNGQENNQLETMVTDSNRNVNSDIQTEEVKPDLEQVQGVDLGLESNTVEDFKPVEVDESEVDESEVDESEVDESEVDESEVDESEVDESEKGNKK